MNLCETNVFKLSIFNMHYPIISVVFLEGFSTLGSTGSIEKLKGGHKGEKWVTISDTVNSMLYSQSKSR